MLVIYLASATSKVIDTKLVEEGYNNDGQVNFLARSHHIRNQ